MTKNGAQVCFTVTNMCFETIFVDSYSIKTSSLCIEVAQSLLIDHAYDVKFDSKKCAKFNYFNLRKLILQNLNESLYYFD